MNLKKKIIFAGTPAFASQSLEAIVEAGFSVPLVLTQPDRPAGRGRALKASAVKVMAMERNIPVWQPKSIRPPEVYEKLKSVDCDFMVVVAYGLIVPKPILEMPKSACINLHASLLPRWRGAAPVQRAIQAGDPYSGVCVMKMEEGLDTGPVVSKVTCPIEDHDNSQALHDKLATLGAEALVSSLEQWPDKAPIPQRDEEALYAKKIEKAEAEIDWSKSAQTIARKVRAFNPWPVCFTHYSSAAEGSKQEVLRLWAVEVLSKSEAGHLECSSAQPGTVIGVSPGGVNIATGEGVIRLTHIQRSGSKALSIEEFIKGRTGFFEKGRLLGFKKGRSPGVVSP